MKKFLSSIYLVINSMMNNHAVVGANVFINLLLPIFGFKFYTYLFHITNPKYIFILAVVYACLFIYNCKQVYVFVLLYNNSGGH